MGQVMGSESPLGNGPLVTSPKSVPYLLVFFVFVFPTSPFCAGAKTLSLTFLSLSAIRPYESEEIRRKSLSPIPSPNPPLNPTPNSGLNGDIEFRRPADATVFEFGSSYEVTICGYYPVSDELEPWRWEILPAGGNAPQFRVGF